LSITRPPLEGREQPRRSGQKPGAAGHAPPGRATQPAPIV